MNDQLVLVQNRIISISKSLIGEEEIPSNAGFKNNINNQFGNPMDFLVAMKSVGWYIGAPWCAATGIWVFEQAYADAPSILGRLRRLVSLNSQQMGRNFHADPIWPTSATEIIPGSLLIYGEGDSATAGHTEIDVDDPTLSQSITSGEYNIVAGNTIPAGNPGNMREGYIVATHTHTMGQPHSTLGLNFIRAIHPLPLDYQF